MSNRSLKGKLFDDGIWRYYDQKQHKWLTQEEIDAQQKAEVLSNVLIAIGSVDSEAMATGIVWKF